MATGTLTGAKLRLTTRSQTYAPHWTAAEWLCFSLWGNSVLSLMLTVVVGYWGLALGRERAWRSELWYKKKKCVQDMLQKIRLLEPCLLQFLFIHKWLGITVHCLCVLRITCLYHELYTTNRIMCSDLVRITDSNDYFVGISESELACCVCAGCAHQILWLRILTQTGQQHNRIRLLDVAQHHMSTADLSEGVALWCPRWYKHVRTALRWFHSFQTLGMWDN